MKLNTLKKALSCMVIASATTLVGCQQEELMENQFESPTAAEVSNNGQAIDGQYIVVFKNGDTSLSSTNVSGIVDAESGATTQIRRKALSLAGIKEDEVIQKFEGVVKGFTARLTQEQLEKLRNDADVAYIEQDRIISLGTWKTKSSGSTYTSTSSTSGWKTKEATPQSTTSTSYTYKTIVPAAGEVVPWNIAKVGFGDGTGKTVWVIDSGVDTDHPDLNIDLNRSKSFIYGQSSVEDGFGHGTSVAGVIAAKNNGSGMIGVASNATVIALRVFDNAGQGTVSRAISAVNHVSYNAKAGDVVNMSLGSGISSTLDRAVKAAAAKGIRFAIAAGNSGVDCAGTSPARVDASGVYTVSAMDNYSRLWSRSNYGSNVDFAAPGVNVTVTAKGGGISGGGYGTSFAAPHVAGVLLLRGQVYSNGTITNDKDSTPDPIASVK